MDRKPDKRNRELKAKWKPEMEIDKGLLENNKKKMGISRNVFIVSREVSNKD